jgi:endonuclease YncB( thermonuclease family)
MAPRHFVQQAVIAWLLLCIGSASAEPTATVHVIDRDTIQARGRIVRLVGLDAPSRSQSP